MSFGVVQSAISSIRNNRNLLSKRDRFKNRLSGKGTAKPEFKAPKATSYQLRAIRDKLIFENRKIRRKQVVALIVFMMILILTFMYLIN